MADTALTRRRLRTGANVTLLLAAISMSSMALGPLPLALLGALGFGAAVALQPWIAVPVIVLTLPYYLHPRTFGGIEVSLTEAAILLGFVGVVVRGLVERFSGAAVRLPRPSVVDWGAAALLVAALLSLFVTEYPRQSLRELRWLIVEPLLVFYIARATIAKPDQVRVVVVWSVVASGVFAALVSLAALALEGALFNPLARATDPYLSPNHLGLFLGRAGAVAFAIALFAPATIQMKDNERRVAWLALIAIAVGLLRTLSLGAWTGFAAAALALSALRSRRWFVGTALVIAILLYVGIAVLPAGRTTGRLDPTTGTALFRLQIWTASLHMGADHPLLGVGLDNFLYQYRDSYMLPEAAEEPNISHPHNWLLNFWLELGLLGLAAALGLLAWTASAAWRLVRARPLPSDRLVGAATIGIFVDALVHGSIDNSYFLVDAAVLWWLFIALVALSTGPVPPPNRASGPVT